ncbi:MAG: hypothetical protein JW866_07285 [Ignavibacteriales bacterium]|nr:hypothetical protein [Ignavibacteriales bacterium]
MENQENLSKILLDSIQEITKEFQEMPYNFFYEEDLRARLYNILREKINYKINLPIEKFGTKEWKNKNNVEKLEINPVKAEYSQVKFYKNLFGKSKFDIVILKDNNKETDFYLWPCSVIIEIKYSTNEMGQNAGRHYDDLIKIQNYKYKNSIKISLHFDLYDIDQEKIAIVNNYPCYKTIDIKFRQEIPENFDSDKIHVFYISSNGNIFYDYKEINN